MKSLKFAQCWERNLVTISKDSSNHPFTKSVKVVKDLSDLAKGIHIAADRKRNVPLLTIQQVRISTKEVLCNLVLSLQLF